ncbi:hypothetical protein LC087_03425 [Bacillus carboniphilus]|uniref:Uncharacterized protein n=1 Tax=Bacillus carboniphilus TaxID=86663 RepID=A0ABY9JWS9_9BACI|nr:hypothetical protein [Bacillus carboniphilus]WLR43259.1 hypothetical protein LC087_03425 [Bacillus carboniphilus]
MTNFNGASVSVIDGNLFVITATVPTGAFPQSVTVNVDLNRIYVVNNGPGNVSVIDGMTNVVIATVTVGGSPQAITHFI